MAAFDILSFDGTTLSTGDIQAWMDPRDPYVTSASLDVQARSGLTPIVTGYALDGTQRIIRAAKRAGSAATDDAFRQQVEALFDPAGNGAPRDLIFTAGDGSTTLRLSVYVERREWLPFGVDQYIIELFAPGGGSVNDNLSTSLANPASVTNAGTTDALPSIALTTTTHVSRAQATYTTSAGQRGRAGVPARISGTFTSATAATLIAFVNGVSVPTRFISQSIIWVVIDVPGNGGTVTVDVLWGTGISNPKGDELANTGDFNFSSSTNTSWVTSAYSVTDNPVRAGEWRPATFGRLVPDGTSYELDDSAGTSVVLKRYTDGRGRNDADSIAMSIPQTTGTSITNLSRVTATHDASSQSFVATRAQGSNAWVDAWTTSANATVTTAITIPTTTVEVAVGTRYIAAAPATSPTLTISGATAIAVDSIGTAVVEGTETIDLYDGTLTIGDDVITFDEVMVKDGTLTVDAATGQITSSTGESYYGAIRGSNPAALAKLEPGANAVSDTLDAGASYTISHRSSFA